MSSKNRSGCIILFLLIFITGAGVTGWWYVKKEYSRQKTALESELASLPVFDEKKAEESCAKELNLPFPVPVSEKMPDEIKILAKKAAIKTTRATFPGTLFAKKQAFILHKYRLAKPGDKISFTLATTGEQITGIYKGLIFEPGGSVVKVGLSKYKLNDIMSDFKYMFIKSIAEKTATDQCKDLKKRFVEAKKKFYLKKKEEYTKEFFKKNNYIYQNGIWIKKTELLKKALEEKKKAFDKKLKKQKSAINEKYKLFGFIEVTPGNNTTKKIEQRPQNTTEKKSENKKVNE